MIEYFWWKKCFKHSTFLSLKKLKKVLCWDLKLKLKDQRHKWCCSQEISDWELLKQATSFTAYHWPSYTQHTFKNAVVFCGGDTDQHTGCSGLSEDPCQVKCTSVGSWHNLLRHSPTTWATFIRESSPPHPRRPIWRPLYFNAVSKTHAQIKSPWFKIYRIL